MSHAAPIIIGAAAAGIAVMLWRHYADQGEVLQAETVLGASVDVQEEPVAAVDWVAGIYQTLEGVMAVKFTDADMQNSNVRAMLRLIRQGESGQGDDAYRVIWGGSTFDSFADHPRRFFTTPDGRKTSAAGAYQITATTWDWIKPRVGVSDFSPASQDRAAVWLMAYRGALDAVRAGRLEDAIAKLRKEWTSLPGAMEQGYTLAKAKQVFLAYGGQISGGPIYA